MSRRRGMALAVIMMATSLLFVVAIGAVTQSTTDLNLVTSRIHQERAFYAAEAGLQAALVEIDKGSGLPASFASFQAVHDNGPDSYQVNRYGPLDVAPDGLTVPANCHYLIATGRTDRGTSRQVACLCTRTAVLFNQGILADSVETTSPHLGDPDRPSEFDAWDSTTNDYAEENRELGVDVISTNSITHAAIKLSDTSKIWGRANSGPGSIPADVIVGGTVGDKEALTTAITFPDPVELAANHHFGDQTISSSQNVTRGRYFNLRIDSNAVATFLPGNYWVSNLTLTGGAKLKVDASDSRQPVRIYVDHTMDIEGDETIVNTAKKASLLRLVYTGADDTLTLSGGSEAYFSLRAPNSDLTLMPGSGHDSTEAYGALQARHVKMYKAKFHYDVGLRQDGYPLGHMLILSHRRL